MEDFLSKLNNSQKDVVLNYKGPCMVIAGAGSGKTRAITTKITYLIKDIGILPHEILAVTFTNKASKEMKERVVKSTGIDEKQLNIYTFHSFCASMLRRSPNLNKVGLSSNYTIYDDSESKSIVRKLLQGKESPTVNEVLEYIDKLKNNGYRENSKDYCSEFINEEFHQYYIDYENELIKSNAVDFGSLLIKFIELLEKNQQTKDYFQNKYKYILVDEYQDTNRVQFDLMNILAEKHKNICVVLDMDQSIYGFRDANIRNVLDFEEKYEGCSVIKLEENYRSTKKILKAANHVIKNNRYRKDKNLYTKNDEGKPIQVLRFDNQNKESFFIASWIYFLLNQKKVKPNEIAVFFRNNAMSRAVEDELRKKRIPYLLFGGLKFYDRKEVKDLLSYLKLAVNWKDDQAVLRSINTPVRGIGKTVVSTIADLAKKESMSIFELLQSEKLPAKIKKKTEKYTMLIKEISEKIENGSKLTELYNFIMNETSYLKKLEESESYEDQARVDNLKELYSSLIQSDDDGLNVVDFLNNIGLGSEDKEISKEDCVYLMTIHSAKGLEFDHVFVIGNEETVFPSWQSMTDPDQETRGVEEERRLFYVAVTRAKKELFLTWASSRMLFGKTMNNGKSRFLIELPRDCIEQS